MKAEGLDGVVVAQTRLSDVDGERGELIIAGSPVEALSGMVSYEEVCARLWSANAKVAITEAQVRARLSDGRAEAFELLPRLQTALEAADGMDALRTAISSLPSATTTREQLVAAMAVFAAAWWRRRRSLPPVAPHRGLGHAEDLLAMERGEPAAPAAAQALDAYLVAVSDHGMNASTFTARVVASTGSDLVSAVTAAIGALKGPLHGGAPGPVLDMLDAIGAPDRAEAWLSEELKSGRRIMGMGHRIYRVRDPRAAVLEAAVERMERAGVRTGRLGLARAVERAATGVLAARHPDRPLKANVEFYTAVLLDSVGLPSELFSPAFAVSRSAGWCAHVEEQQLSKRIIRPASVYLGPRDPPARAVGA